MQQSMIPGNLRGFHSQEIHENRKQLMGNFSGGMGEVQMYQMNRWHNDDITNVNGQWSDN